ncbi:MAG: hypothetical protein GXP27_06785 [Planctomycetes bacterium]|nr:hypothetical protein [Planctomycetota bacterium]
MPVSPFRFLHAANLRLDHPLEGVKGAPDDAFLQLRDATLTAFDRLIAACGEQGVDFLLLTGNTLAAAGRSLRAIGRLRCGLEELAERDIPALIVPGRLDPWEVWRSVPGLPDNVVLLDPSDPDPVTVSRDGTPLATVRVLAESPAKNDDSVTVTFRPSPSSPSGADESAAFPIGVALRLPSEQVFTRSRGNRADDESCRDARRADGNSRANGDEPLQRWAAQWPVRYLAVGEPTQRMTLPAENALVHASGTTQPIGAGERGPGGATLVRVHQDGTISTTFIPTGVVRWERLELPFDGTGRSEEDASRSVGVTTEAEGSHQQNAGQAGWEGWLIDRMRAAVESLALEPDELVCIVDWRLILLEGPERPECAEELAGLLRAVGTSSARSRLIERLHEATDGSESRLYVHRVSIDRLAAGLTEAANVLAGDDTIAADFLQKLGRLAAEPEEMMRLVRHRATRIAPELAERLAEPAAAIDANRLTEEAFETGMVWLGGPL